MLVDGDDLEIVFFAEIHCRRYGAKDPGIVHQHGYRPKRLFGFRYDPCPFGSLGNVLCNEQGIAAQFLRQGSTGLFSHIGHNDLGALLHKLASVRCTHAARSPGYDCYLPIQSAHHSLLIFC